MRKRGRVKGDRHGALKTLRERRRWRQMLDLKWNQEERHGVLRRIVEGRREKIGENIDDNRREKIMGQCKLVREKHVEHGFQMNM